MKAILEMDVPESCVVCPAGHGNPCGSGQYCKVAKQVFSEAYSKQTERAPFCPLKIVPEHISATFDNLLRVPEDVQMKLHETTQRIADEGSGGLICIIL